MAFTLTAGPTVEPVSIEEAKAFLRIDHDGDDTFVSSLITTSRLQIEAALDIALINQTWRWRGTCGPSRAIELRPHPVVSVEGVAELTSDATTVPIASAGYNVDLDQRPARVKVADGTSRRLEVVFTAGFGESASDVPGPIRQAILQLVAHWYENREPVVIGETVNRIPDSVSALLMPYREARV